VQVVTWKEKQVTKKILRKTLIITMTLTFSGYGSLDCDEHHVTALWSINRACRSWSRDNIQMTHDSECNITHVNNVISRELTKCKCNIKTHVRRHHMYDVFHHSTSTRTASELISETVDMSLK